jgi:hypothetical protein
MYNIGYIKILVFVQEIYKKKQLHLWNASSEGEKSKEQFGESDDKL